MFTTALFLLALAVIGWGVFLARQSWRDPKNWQVDIETNELAFDAFSEFATAMLTTLMGVAIAGFTLLA